MTNQKFIRFILMTSIPLIIQSMFMQSLDLIDQIMISSLGTKEIAAIGVCTKVVGIYFGALYGSGSGSAFFLNQYYGKRDDKNYRIMYGVDVGFCVIASLIMASLVFFVPRQIMGLFTEDPEVIQCGVQYFRVAGFAYLFNGITFPIAYAMKGLGYVKHTLCVTIVSILTNISLDYVFIFGMGPIPSFGVAGAAMGTVVARFVEIILYHIIIYKNKYTLLMYGKDMFMFRFQRVVEFLKTVVPLILNEILWATGFTVYYFVFGKYGTEALAACSIMNTLLMVSKLLLGGFAGAAQIVVGRALGQKDIKLVDWYVKRFLIIAGGVGVITASLIIIMINPVLSIYGIAGSLTGEYVRKCMFVLAGYAFMDSLTSINVEGLFRVSGDTRFIAFIDMGSVWIVGVTFAAIMGLVFHISVPLVYLAVLVTEIYKLPIILKRLVSKKWIHYA